MSFSTCDPGRCAARHPSHTASPRASTELICQRRSRRGAGPRFLPEPPPPAPGLLGAIDPAPPAVAIIASAHLEVPRPSPARRTTPRDTAASRRASTVAVHRAVLKTTRPHAIATTWRPSPLTRASARGSVCGGSGLFHHPRACRRASAAAARRRCEIAGRPPQSPPENSDRRSWARRSSALGTAGDARQIRR
jgi:hypothetical protein